jgi:hypothetical protein
MAHDGLIGKTMNDEMIAVLKAFYENENPTPEETAEAVKVLILYLAALLPREATDEPGK